MTVETTLTEDELEMRAVAERATPGPWKAEPQAGKGAWIAGPSGEWAALSCGTNDERGAANAAFIASARTWVPALLDALSSAREEIAGLTAALRDAHADRDNGYALSHRGEADRAALQAALDEARALLRELCPALNAQGYVRLVTPGDEVEWLARRDVFLSRQTNPNQTEIKPGTISDAMMLAGIMELRAGIDGHATDQQTVANVFAAMCEVESTP